MNAIKPWVQQNKIVTVLFVFAIIEILIHLLLSQSLISFFYNRYNTTWLKGNILFGSFILTVSWALRVISQNKNIFSSLVNHLMTLKEGVVKQRKVFFLALGLGLFFYGLYLALGIALIPNYAANKFTFFFADSYKWLGFDLSRYHKGSHPLMLMFVEFFGFLRVFSSVFPTVNLAVTLNAFFGATALFFSALFFWNYTKKYGQTILLTVAFGLTMTQLFFSVLLESYALSAASIIANYVLLMICLNQRKPYWGYWIIVGIFSFGVTITNFAQSMICFGVILFLFKKENRWVSMLEYIGTIVFLAFFLSLVQNKLFGGEFFFAPSASGREAVWIRTTIFSEPLLVLQELTKHFFLVNFVSASPFPTEIVPGEKIILSFFDRPLNYSVFGLIGTLIWLFILVIGVYRNFIAPAPDTPREHTFLLTAVGLSLLGNLGFYSIFNAEEMFIYTCHFTFLVWVLATPKSLLNQRYFQIAIALLILFMGINNLNVMRQIIMT